MLSDECPSPRYAQSQAAFFSQATHATPEMKAFAKRRWLFGNIVKEPLGGSKENGRAACRKEKMLCLVCLIRNERPI